MSSPFENGWAETAVRFPDVTVYEDMEKCKGTKNMDQQVQETL